MKMNFTAEHHIDSASKIIGKDADPVVVEIAARIRNIHGVIDADSRSLEPMPPIERFRFEYLCAEELLKDIQDAK